MGMVAILFNGAEPVEVNILSIKGPIWNLLNTARELSEKKQFKVLWFYTCI